MADFQLDCGARLRSNAFLGSLGAEDASLILPALETVRCGTDERLSLHDSEGGSIYFPITMVIGLTMQQRTSAIGLVGREGLVGWPSLLRKERQAPDATVLLDGGTAFVLPVECMREALFSSPSMVLGVLNYARLYTQQLGLLVMAGTCSSLRQRVCLWLLMLHDRVEGDILRTTHQALSAQLGVRRASITDILHTLEGESALQCERSVIFVRDRRLLERSAGDAYRGEEAIAAPASSGIIAA